MKRVILYQPPNGNILNVKVFTSMPRLFKHNDYLDWHKHRIRRALAEKEYYAAHGHLILRMEVNQ